MFISEAWLGVYIVGGEFYSNEPRAPEVNFFYADSHLFLSACSFSCAEEG